MDIPLELLLHVLSTMRLLEMRQFMRANKACRELCRSFLQRKYEIALRPYIDFIDEFRAIMRYTRSIISGSLAVDFGLHSICSPEFTPNDIDLYTGATSALLVIQHLRHREGYTATPISSYPPRLLIDDYNGGISAVVRMRHPKKPKIDVICSSRISALHPLAFFWGTIPMTYLTADGFCTAYPELFFNLKGCLNPVRSSTDRVKKCLEKYRDRGFFIGTFEHNDVSIVWRI